MVAQSLYDIVVLFCGDVSTATVCVRTCYNCSYGYCAIFLLHAFTWRHSGSEVTVVGAQWGSFGSGTVRFIPRVRTCTGPLHHSHYVRAVC